MRCFGVILALLIGLVGGNRCAAQEMGGFGFDLAGQPVRELAVPGTKVVVLLFVSTDCPVSNRYVPEIARLEGEFARRNVVFWLVYPNVGETIAVVREHQRSYAAGERGVVLDPQHRLVAMGGATVTPEAAVLVPDGTGARMAWRTVYHGRIDDRYVRIGLERPQAERHDLEMAIGAVLDHKAISPPGGPAVGCGIIGQP